MFKTSPSPIDLVTRAKAALEAAISAESSKDATKAPKSSNDSLNKSLLGVGVGVTAGASNTAKTPQTAVPFLPSTEINNDASFFYNSLAEHLSAIRIVFYGEAEQPPIPARSLEMRNVILSSPKIFEIFVLLIGHIRHIPFQARKDTAAIFTHLTRQDALNEGKDSSSPNFSHYILSRYNDIIPPLIDGHRNADIALICGSMFRSTTANVELYKKIIVDPRIWIFFDEIVHMPNFDIVSDTFETITTLLSRKEGGVFLENNYDIIFPKYEKILKSNNYISRRLSLKLLAELLLDRVNFSVMMRYISSRQNLITLMNLLRDPSGNIQFEAFHVFKVFVVNPRKPPEINKILLENKMKLCLYLENFHKEKEEDEQFRDEKKLVIDTLNELT